MADQLDRPGRPRAQPQGRLARPAPRRADRLHRAVRVGQVAAWPSTRSSPRASAATSSRCRPTPASSSARWTSPTSTSSRACRRRSRSTRSPPRGTRARPSAPSPRSTTTCGCSTPASGVPHCPICGAPISRQTPQQIVDRMLELPEGTRFQVLAPVVRGRKGEYVELFRELQAQGFSRARVDGDAHRARRPAEAQASRRSTPSRWWSTGWRSRRRPSGGSPTRSRPRSSLAGGLRASSTSSTCPTTTRTAS